MITTISHSPADTHALGIRIGALVQPGTVITLDGPLGAGKTALVAGIAQGAGVPATTIVNSPTYIMMNHYQGRLPIYHFDWYRLADARQLDGIDCDEYLYGDGVTLIEWAEKFPTRIPANAWRVQLQIDSDTVRTVRISTPAPIGI